MRANRLRNRGHYIVYCVVRVVEAVLGVLPERAVLASGRLLGAVVHRLDARHRNIALANVAAASGMPTDDAARRRIVRDVFRHFGTCVMEMLLLPRLAGRAELADRVERVDFHHIDAALARGKGVILVAPHLGNWEITALSLAAAGYDLRSVTLPLSNPYVHRHFLEQRTSVGHTLIPREGAIKGMLRCLSENGILVFLADQNAHRQGVGLNFFGRATSTIRAPAVLAIKCGAPIVPLNLYRVEGAHHRAVATAPLDADPALHHDKAVARLTRQYTRRFEAFVREHPSQWVWMHRRWR